MYKYVEDRPWGSFRLYALNEACTVKILSVATDQQLSLQSHNERWELWVVLDGHVRVTIAGSTFLGKAGDTFEVPKGLRHRLQAVGGPARVLEISFGHFDESDEVRYEDDYART